MNDLIAILLFPRELNQWRADAFAPLWRWMHRRQARHMATLEREVDRRIEELER